MATSSPSKRYEQLERELSRIKTHMLPRKLSSTGLYSERVFARTIAFRLLAHAEIEAYLEDRVWELALNSLAAMQAGAATRVAVALVAFSGVKSECPPDSLKPSKAVPLEQWNQRISVCAKLQAAVDSFRWLVQQNHGMREENLLQLLVPVGVDVASLDSVWIASMDSYGSTRGTYAHSSASSYRATLKPDPQTELTTIGHLLAGLRDVDYQVNVLTS